MKKGYGLTDAESDLFHHFHENLLPLHSPESSFSIGIGYYHSFSLSLPFFESLLAFYSYSSLFLQG